MKLRQLALRFIVLLGIVSLFADMTYEGARSISGPYLSLLGASGAAVGIIVGLGELIGYGIRGISGYLSDKTQRYWLLTFIGYIINLAAVPLLALAGSWQMAAMLIILERLGKAIRTPARDAMLSYATKHTGRGWGFGLHEALDQIGAVIGPLALAVLLYLHESYRFGFAVLLIPALLSILTLVLARISFPKPQMLEVATPSLHTTGFSRTFWIYLLAVGFVGAGFVDFALIAYHFQKAATVSPAWIPFLYAIAMAVDGLAALIMGRLFDLKGLSVLALVTAITSLFAPLVFLGSFTAVLVGMILWGISMGAQESIMRAAVATFVPPQKRGAGYGMLNLVFGVFWAAGSAIKGLFYDISLIYLVVFSLVMQLISIPLFLSIKAKN